ncbi:hypothetical protein OESDEN_06907 [Oesophagostomum dentatum]|uniref:Uncharacterized protein n=1 Tax=Oesophagostomum dentatum TaxID=61180 RepID=A0A0B1TCX1_OESDE|nr:hypothetical protein OESDEN_06907 [Oesophagostomum dentatum]
MLLILLAALVAAAEVSASTLSVVELEFDLHYNDFNLNWAENQVRSAVLSTLKDEKSKYGSGATKISSRGVGDDDKVGITIQALDLNCDHISEFAKAVMSKVHRTSRLASLTCY